MLFEPANAVTRVAANFSNIAERSSCLICGAEDDIVGTEVEVDCCKECCWEIWEVECDV